MIETPDTASAARRRRRSTGGICLALLLCGAAAIGGEPAPQKPPTPPSWYTRLPSDPKVLYAKATASAKDKQLSIDKAVHDARVLLGQMVQARTDSIRRSAERETALDLEGTERYQHAEQKIATELKGSRIRNQKAVKKSKTWTAFVVVELAVGAASDALVGAVRNDAVLSPTFGSTQAFRALDAEAAAYRAKQTSSHKKK